MAAEQGKTIVRNLVEYPLPERSGVRDYVFYLVQPDHYGYGWASRRFFADFYKQHHKYDANSLEGVIDVLHAEVTQHGVQQIREVVIVTHSNPQAMLFRILEDASASQQLQIPYVNELTLARLRKHLLEQQPQVAALKTKREAVIARLLDDSWVTIRGCNFGSSNHGMYATYAFFGGRANAFGPRRFMHFGEYAIDPGFARLSSGKKFHEHLVRQHFLPQDRTQQRAAEEVAELYDPALFSQPHVFASVPLSNATSAQQSDFDALVAALNNRSLSAPVVARLADMMAALSIPGWAPTPAARVTVNRRDVAWTVRDTLAHEDIAYHILYKVDIAVDSASKTLRAQAQLSLFERRKVAEAGLVMLQLFLTASEDDFLRGRLRLAGFAEHDKTDDRKNRFVAVLKLLRLNKLSDPSVPGVDLQQQLLEGLGVTLTQPQLSTVSAPPDLWPEPGGSFGRAEWALRDASTKWSIKLENPSTPDGDQGYTIAVYPAATPRELYLREMAYLADNVGNADTPGTELAAYFDRFTIDELLSVVEFLRSPFKPGHSLYIAHAQQAMKRKKEFEQWVRDHHPDLYEAYGTPMVSESEWEMTSPEPQDKRDTSYEFDFNDTWCSVKALFPAHIPFQSDLFLEEDFAGYFNLSLDSPLQDSQTDSPVRDQQEPTPFEAKFSAQPSATEDKSLFDEQQDETIGCLEFKQAITAIMAAKDLPVPDIEDLLENHATTSGSSYFDIAQGIASKYSFVRKMANWVQILPKEQLKKLLPWIPSSTESLVTEPLKRILESEVKREVAWWASTEGAVVADTAILQSGLGLLWAWGIITVPGKMLLHIAEVEAETDEKWEAIGYVTAIRQWLRRAATLTYHAIGLPDLHSIHVDTPVSTETTFYPFANEPYYIGRYFLEQVEDSGGRYSPFIWANEPLQRGFDHGVMVMVFTVADELKRRAERGVDELLTKWDLDSCQIGVLIDAGILDIGSLQAAVISSMASAMLAKVPHA